jgi:hypothetical protein
MKSQFVLKVRHFDSIHKNVNFFEFLNQYVGNRLIVQGQNKLGAQSEEFSREFTRNFTIPSDVDQLTIRAQLDESTRLLTLIGQLKKEEKKESNGNYSAYDDDIPRKIGSINETRNGKAITYEVYLGDALKDGEAFVEVSGQNSLLIRVIKNDWDKYGDFGFELKRQIKLPNEAVVQEIDHGLNQRNSTLVVKVPLK